MKLNIQVFHTRTAVCLVCGAVLFARAHGGKKVTHDTFLFLFTPADVCHFWLSRMSTKWPWTIRFGEATDALMT